MGFRAGQNALCGRKISVTARNCTLIPWLSSPLRSHYNSWAIQARHSNVVELNIVGYVMFLCLCKNMSCWESVGLSSVLPTNDSIANRVKQGYILCAFYLCWTYIAIVMRQHIMTTVLSLGHISDMKILLALVREIFFFFFLVYIINIMNFHLCRCYIYWNTFACLLCVLNWLMWICIAQPRNPCRSLFTKIRGFTSSMPIYIFVNELHCKQWRKFTSKLNCTQ